MQNLPNPPFSEKILRYREHRTALFSLVSNAALSPRYAMFSELILLWLDSKPEWEPKLWACLAFFIGVNRTRKAGREEYEVSEFTEDSPVDKEAKEKLKGYLDDFLQEEDPVENEPKNDLLGML